MTVKHDKNTIIFEKISTLSVPLSLDCGQAFRWIEKDNGSWHGVAFGKAVDIYQKEDNLRIEGCFNDGDKQIWANYFDLGRDYFSICEKLKNDPHLKTAIEAYPGIRILRQESWEALCSFIISQNNNIPRIKGIVERLCGYFGEDLGNGDFTFPSAEKLASLTVDDLAPIRSGFRAKYIIDAAQKVTNGEVNLQKLSCCDIDEAREELIKIKGVGAKVAECTLLYGCGRVDAFPVDVWVRRIMSEMYPDGLPECTNGVEGIAQQYLFHWRRNTE